MICNEMHIISNLFGTEWWDYSRDVDIYRAY